LAGRLNPLKDCQYRGPEAERRKPEAES
jgi:hypothetical protein